MASTTSENHKRNEKKSVEQEEANFVSRITVTLTIEKKRERETIHLSYKCNSLPISGPESRLE